MLSLQLKLISSATVARTILSCALLSLTVPVAAVSTQEKPVGSTNQHERRLIELAQTTAAIAGGARFCKLDPDDIEEFISKADAQIVLLARDDYQKVLGRLEFKNILAATSAREPVSGCQKLATQFNTMLRETR